MTVVMKIDLAGPARRGLALGLNESAGYLGVAATAFATGALASSYAPRTLVWVGAAVIAAVGAFVSIVFVRDTGAHVAHEQRTQHGESVHEERTFRAMFAHASLREPVLRACSQAGLVNNLNDALAWGLAPLHPAAPPGRGPALVYPTLIAAVADAVEPRERAKAVGVYRFWRDFGFAAGALVAGFVADALGSGAAITVVAGLTAGSGLWVAGTRWHPRPSPAAPLRTAPKER